MAIKILMPALSPTMEEGNLAKWLKKEGDSVEPGDLLAEIETDKAIMELEAVDSGTIGKIIIQEGTKNIKVNELIAILLEEGEDKAAIDNILKQDIKSIEKDKTATQSPKENITETPKTLNENQIPTQTTENNRIFATPLAKSMAKESNINITSISGTGPKGRIVKNDVLQAIENQKSTTINYSSNLLTRNSKEISVMPVSNIRSIIAKKLVQAKQEVPHFYLDADCKIDQLIKIRKIINDDAKINNEGKPIYKISINDFIVKAVAKSLKDFPSVNSSWLDGSIVQYNNIDISIAVAIKDGLITPIVKNADLKSIIDISNEIKVLALKAKDMKLQPEEFQGGSFSISNLGMYGVKSFNAIINPPQACIMAVGAGIKQPVVEGEEIKITTVMNVRLSCDHRIIDGALGAEFLNQFKKYIENPSLALV